MKLASLVGLLCLLALGCAAPPSQDSILADGMAAYERGDHEAAREILKPLAIELQPDAAYILGEMYAYTQGVPQDYSEAYYWYLVAGRYGNPKAQMVLGSLFGGGLGVQRSYRRSLEWYQCVFENETSSENDRYAAAAYLAEAFNAYNIEAVCSL